MSALLPGLSSSLPFYLSGPLPCPYLPDRVERKLFARLTEDPSINDPINGALTRIGFRRSHTLVYRPACLSCNACVPIRIVVNQFKPSRSLKRTIKRNRDLVFYADDDSALRHLYQIFVDYERNRHPDSDMAQMSFEEFTSLAKEGNVSSRLYRLQKQEDGSFLGGIIADQIPDGFSAVYSFFRPDRPKRSLGTQLILSLIAEAQRLNLPYVYLGYWIASARKMAYKTRFPAIQTLGPHGWTPQY